MLRSEKALWLLKRVMFLISIQILAKFSKYSFYYILNIFIIFLYFKEVFLSIVISPHTRSFRVFLYRLRLIRVSPPGKQNDMEDRYMNRSRAEEPPDQNTSHNLTEFAGDLKKKVDTQTDPYPKADPNLLCRYTYLAVSPETQDGRRFQPRILRRRSSKPPEAPIMYVC